VSELLENYEIAMAEEATAEQGERIYGVDVGQVVALASGRLRTGTALAANSFAELHDFADANLFGFLDDDEHLADGTAYGDLGIERAVDVMNRVQGIVDAWLKSGEARREGLVMVPDVPLPPGNDLDAVRRWALAVMRSFGLSSGASSTTSEFGASACAFTADCGSNCRPPRRAESTGGGPRDLAPRDCPRTHRTRPRPRCGLEGEGQEVGARPERCGQAEKPRAAGRRPAAVAVRHTTATVGPGGS